MTTKKTLMIGPMLLAVFALMTMQAFVMHTGYLDPKKTPGPQHTPPGLLKTPGAKATEKALEHGKRQNYRGVIAAVDATSLTLTLRDGSQLNFLLTPQTQIHIPGRNGKDASLEVGMQAMVQATADQSGMLTALRVMAIPGKPVRVHRVGTVTAYTPGQSITIEATDGNSYTFALSSDVKILPKDRADDLGVGSRVTIIAPRDPSTQIWTAIGIVVHPAGTGAGTGTPAPGTGTPTETPTATPMETETPTVTATATETPTPTP